MSGRTRATPCPPTRKRQASPEGVGPVRTCVGCRARAAKADLVRVVAVEGECVPDPAGTLPGRGAHVHHDPECLARAERRKAFPRALRVSGPLDTERLHAVVVPR
ncbi:YlxR family protein [Yinghuangia sp. ASG 101]|uniref:YlxR family protein n=1 Tax=Yinghuangia sp. ASG 101 TaxID=2896848 RepID=UPI001E28C8E7|nr:YlxR family protein [Yinghuangia sp. ASG 101]UGQ09896.1 YlxR family protein [Yinghuangia sp. ASG 101]